ncbi:exodeoxyribonuclease I [Candidatus Saccharibacteria bacterium]|nr:exodeoxyribonuclease I [Candidatus Saccharibacteria bacterium]
MAASPSLFFYDLETSGTDPRKQRIMQFAGQRTDLDLNLIGEPFNLMVALTDEVLPDPQAIMITGISPQKTQEEGYSEAEFLRIFQQDICVPGTTMLGFNSVRFDDEFMRHTLYRNFYDAYEWSWKDGCSRWDLLDVVRMTRALRPDGIKWPVTPEGAPTNRLELLTKENGLTHEHAHDALSDVLALIDVARLIRQKQPKLYDYLFKMRAKKCVEDLVNPQNPQPFVYTSGRYPKETLHTTVAFPLSLSNYPGTIIVYDLRHDPADWADKSVEELRSLRFVKWEDRQKPEYKPFPAKELGCNKCPAVAPMGTFDAAAQERLGLSLETIEKHKTALIKTGLAQKLQQVFAREKAERGETDCDGALYDGFIGEGDKTKMRAVRAADRSNIASLKLDFNDNRLASLLPRYKARNYPQTLSSEEKFAWEEYRTARLQADAPGFLKQMQELAKQVSEEQDDNKAFLLQELQLWFESIMPVDD